MLLAGVLCGLGFGVIVPSAQAIAVAASPEHRVGVAVSTYFLALDLGTGLGPVLFGSLVPLTGYTGVYWVAAALVGVGALCFWLLRPRGPGMAQDAERLTQS